MVKYINICFSIKQYEIHGLRNISGFSINLRYLKYFIFFWNGLTLGYFQFNSSLENGGFMNIPEFCFLEKLDSYTSSAANCIFSFTHVSYTFSQGEGKSTCSPPHSWHAAKRNSGCAPFTSRYFALKNSYTIAAAW